jgi:hypothetical protein
MKMGKGYYAYIVLGLAAVVAVSVIAATSSSDPSGADAMPWIIGSIVAFVLGMIVLQWRGVYAARPKGGPDVHTNQAGQGTADAGQVDSYDELMSLMATEKYDEQAVAASRGSGFSLMKGYMGFTTILVGICLVLGGLGITGHLPDIGDSEAFRWAPILLVPIVLFFIRQVMSRATGNAQAQLAPLGLGITETPEPGIQAAPWQGSGMQSAVYGATVMSGRRRGRLVEVRLDGRRQTTTVGGAYPEFEVSEKRGKLQASAGAPPGVVEVLAGLSASDHWKKLGGVEGGPSGVTAQRKTGREQTWLWDLWLCELLADRAR